MGTQPTMVSTGCQVQTIHRVPSTSSQETTQNAPTNSKGERPHRRKPSRHSAQNAPSASCRSPARAYPATSMTATTVRRTSTDACLRAHGHAPKSSAAR